jgi:predicted small secreted protein
MKNNLACVLASAAFILTACGDVTGVPTDIAKACDAANDGKPLEIAGFVDSGRSVFCSNTGGGPVRCGFDFKETAGGPRKMGIDIKQGGSANSVEKLPKGYKKTDIKIYGDDGKQIDLSGKVKVTGKLSATPDGKVCFITAAKIEKM